MLYSIFMKKSILTLLIFAVISSCGPSQHGYFEVPSNWVYSIKQHRDSIYFSTSEKGIFRFDPEKPSVVAPVARYLHLPFRSLVFLPKQGTCLASSYYAGVFSLTRDTLVPLHWASYPAWAIKLDENENIWLAGDFGIFHQRADTLQRFCDIREGHDIAFWGNNVVVAHMKGISIYDKETGKHGRDYAQGMVCWSCTVYDSLLVAGGIGRCLVISKQGCHEIKFGSANDILWATALLPHDTLVLATQKGLFRAHIADSAATLWGYKNSCVKSLLLDNKNRLWVGTFDHR